MAICCMFVYDPAATSGVEKLRARMVGIRPLGGFLYLNWVHGFLIHHVFYCSMLQDASGCFRFPRHFMRCSWFEENCLADLSLSLLVTVIVSDYYV